jgi:transposase-like protein
MSRKRKLAAVLRLLRGEDLEMVSRELCVSAATLSGWREAFLAGGEASLTSREKDSRDLDIERLKTQLGEMLLDRELLKDKIRHLEAGRPLGRRSRR